MATWNQIPKEDEMMIRGWNSTTLASVNRCAHDIFQDQVALNPAHEAVCSHDGVFSRSELDGLSTRLAAYLVATYHIGPEQFVTLCFDKGIWNVVAMLAVLKAGAAFVPLDPTTPHQRLQALCEKTNSPLLLCLPHHSSKLSSIAPNLLAIDADILRTLPSAEFKYQPRRHNTRNAAYLIFTSGSTGEPKGTIVEHGALCTSIGNHGPKMFMDSNSRVLQFAAHTFDASVQEILSTLLSGGTVCIPDENMRLNHLTTAINDMGVNWACLTPSVVNLITPSDVPNLRTLILVGEPMSQSHIATWSPFVKLINGYGPTECTIAAVANNEITVDSHPQDIGHPLGVHVWIVDPEDHHLLVSVGSVGELLIQGPTLARGYLNDTSKTAEAFISLPSWASVMSATTNGNRMYKTGDLVSQNSAGSLRFIGRKDNQVKIHGQRVELGEIEHNISLEPSVKHCLTFLPKCGPFQNRLICVLSLHQQSTSSEDTTPIQALTTCKETQAVRKNLETRLPSYMVPFIIPVQAIPLQASGKLDRKFVARWLENMDNNDYNNLIEESLPEPTATNSLPRPLTEVEGLLQTIWSRVLNLRLEKIQLDRSFLSLGGDSISAMQVMSACSKNNLAVTVQDILRTKSITELASQAKLLKAKLNHTEVTEQLFDLSPIQKLFFSLPNQGHGHFNQSFFLQITRRVTATHLQRAIEIIVKRHSMLRARFSRSNIDQSIHQRITDDIASSYRFRTHNIHTKDQAVSSIEASQKYLSPWHGPLFAVDVFDVAGGDQLLFMVGHHLVIDLVSWRVILEELEELLLNPLLNSVGDAPLPFQTWCHLQVQHARDFQLDKVLPSSEIPVGDFKFWDMENRPNTYGCVNVQGFEIDATTTSQFLTQCHGALKTEPIDILVSALVWSFAKTFKERSVPALYVEGHGREPSTMAVDLSRTVGWFTTMYPISIPTSASASTDPIDTVKHVKDFRRRVPDNGRPYFAARCVTDTGNEIFGHHWPLEITFNFLGQYQQLERQDGLLRPVEDMAGEARGSGGVSDVGSDTPRFGLFEISAVVVQGKLRFSFTFNRRIKHQHRILKWISECELAIGLIAGRLASMLPQLTASDFPLMTLTPENLDKLTQQVLPRLDINNADVIEDIYPCSAIQEGLLISQSRNSALYEDHVIYEVKLYNGAKPDIGRLQNAWQMVVDRHPTLRTLFIEHVGEDEGVYDQVVLKKWMVDIALCKARDGEEAIRILKGESFKGAPTQASPSHQFTICQTSDHQVFCKLDISHAIIDGESVGTVIFKDLATAYEGQLLPGSGPLYSDYVAFLQNQPSSAGLKYWKLYLAGTEPCNFPVLNDGLHAATKRLQSLRLDLGSHEYLNIQRFCESRGFTFSNVLHVAWALTLRLYTGSNQPCFGYLSSTRGMPIERAEDAVGPYINMLVCRLKVNQDTCIDELLQQVQEDYVQSLPYKHTSLAGVQHELQLSGTPLFNTSLSYRKIPLALTEDPSTVSFTQSCPTYDPTEYPLSINIESTENSAAIDLDYWTDHISDGQASNIASTFVHALHNITHRSEQAVSHLPCLSKHDHQQILSWNRDMPKTINDCVHKVIERQARIQPDAPAIHGWDASFSYSELDHASSKLAMYLMGLNVGPEMLVPVCFEKSSWTIVAMIAILKAGGAVVPLDPNHPQAALEVRIRDTKAQVVLTTPNMVPLFDDLVPHVVSVSSSFLRELPDLDGREACTSVQPENSCFIIYTSGSTGTPKGVVLEHRNLVTSADAHGSRFGFGPGTRVLQFSAYTFDNSLEDIFTTLMRGACVCVISENDRYNNLASAINEMDVTFMDLTPTVASFLHPSQVRKVRGVCLGGEPITKENVEVWDKAVQLHGCYGPSECSVNSTWNGSLANTTEPSNLGRAIGSVSWIVDPLNHNILLPIGCVGELLIEGPIVSRGYLNDTVKTAASFIVDPAWASGKGRRMYKTGDLVRYNSDGTITYLGRRDTQVKLNGQRLELGEIEHHVKASLPQDTQSAVELVRPENGNKALAVFFSQRVRQSDDLLKVEDGLLLMTEPLRALAKQLETSLSKALLPYMMPTLFIPVAKMPMTASEKVDRRKLRAMCESLSEKQAAIYRLAKQSTSLVSTSEEKKLAALWESVLKLQPGSIGADDDFFQAGGDSVGAMRLIVAARKQGISLSITSIFKKSTLSELAKEIAREEISAPEPDALEVAPAAVVAFSLVKSPSSIFKTIREVASLCELDPEAIQDIYPASLFQEGLVALSTKSPGAYVAQNIYQLPSNVDISKFKVSWAKVFASEEILRTHIVHTKDHGFLQVVVDEAICWNTLASLEDLTEVSRQLPSTNGGVLSSYAIVGEHTNSPKFVWTAHHAVYDGWSVPLLFEKLEACYYADNANSLRPNVPYTRFINYLSGIKADDSDNFWRSKLSGTVSAQFPALPHPAYHVQATSLLKQTVSVSRNQGSRITLPSTIRAAWALTLAIYSGVNEDVAFGEILTGRDIPVPGIADMIGPTLATVPTRISINSEATAAAFLEMVQIQGAEVVQYQHAGLQHIRSLSEDSKTACQFQNILAINFESQPSAGGLCEMSEGTADSNFSSYPLAVLCDIGEISINVDAHFDPAVISTWQVERLINQFDFFLQRLNSRTGSDEKLCNISTLNQSDEATIQSWNETPLNYVNKCIHQMFEAQARLQPMDKTAVDSYNAKLTYRELNRLSTRLSQHLLERGISGNIIPFCFEKSAWAVVAMLAILKAGKAFVPLDPSAPLARLKGIVDDTRADAILCSSKYQGLSQSLAKHSIVVDQDAIDFLPNSRTTLPQYDSNSPAYVIFTSGSTGKPKGTIIEHAAFCTSAAAHGPALQLSASSRALQFASYTFDVSLMEILTTLTLGGCVCVPDEETRLNNISSFIASKRITWAALTPTFAQMIQPSDVPCLRTLCLGGESMSRSLIATWADSVNLINAYGPSECAVTSAACTDVNLSTDPANIGYATGSKTWIVDPRNHDKLAPVGSIGELVIEGPLARGYLNDEAKTAEVFIESPRWVGIDRRGSHTAKRRMYKTGDLVRYLSDGSMVFCKRKDTQTKVHGQRMELGEVEHFLREDAETRHVLAVVPKTGHLKSRLVAVLSLQTIQPTNSTSSFDIVTLEKCASLLAAIRERLCDQLPAYMIPANWIVLQRLPVMPSGKLDRLLTAKWVEDISDDAYRQICDVDNQDDDTPVSETEGSLQTIWGEVLNLPAEKIGLHKSFIHLGGDSISAMQVMSRCRAKGMGVTVQNILQSKSITELASRVVLPKEESFEVEVVDQPFDLSPVQKLYFDAVGDRTTQFNQSTILRLARRVDPSAIGRAVAAIVKTHSMLRARFFKNDFGVWQQRIIPLDSSSCRIKSRRTTMNSIQSLVNQSQKSLDIENGPTFAADLFDVESHQVLFLVAHHLVIDVVSWRVILQDLEDMLNSGRFEILPSLSFQTWTKRQAEHAQHMVLRKPSQPEDVPAADFAYWGMEGKTNFYTDVVSESFSIESKASSHLLGQCHDPLQTQPIDIFIASVLTALRIAFRDRPTTPAVFNEGHGREPWAESGLDLSRTVGWFTTICPLYMPSTVQGAVDIVDTISWIKDLRSRIPDKGREYFESRYLTEAGKDKFASHWPMEISFNYLGKLQQLERKEALLQPFDGVVSADSDIGPDVTRFSLIDISVVSKNEQLQFSISYNKQMNHQGKIRQFAREVKLCLESSAQKLLQLKSNRTLADFPLLPLSFDGLNRFTQKLAVLNHTSLDDIQDAYPCSPMQRGILLSQRKSPDLYAYSSIFEVRCQNGSRVDVAGLVKSWKATVQQHVTLRTVFIDGVCRDGEVGQIVLKTIDPRIVHLRCRQTDVQRVLQEQSPPVFSEPQPPHRLTICSTDLGKVFCKLEMSHAISDGGSLPVMFGDLSRHYQKMLSSRTTDLQIPIAPLFSDYIAHISNDSERGMNYWKTYLAGIQPCRLPPINDGLKRENLHQTHLLELTNMAQLRRFCSEQNMTPANLFQLAWGLILRLYTGLDEVCFGYLTSGRDAPIQGLQDLAVGTFINMLVCRLEFTAKSPLSHLLRQMQSDFVAGMEHQSCSLADVQHELHLSGISLFNTAFSFQNRLSVEKTVDDTLLFDILDTYDPSEYDVGINIEAFESRVEVNLSYWTASLSDSQAVNMAHTFDHIVNSIMSSAPDLLVADMDFLSGHSHRQILAWNHTLPSPIEKRIQDVIHEQQLTRPPATQAVCSWDLNLTYTELDELTTSLAFQLVAFGVGPEVFVPVCFEKSVWAVVAIVGILKAGGAFVPLDPSHPQSRLQHIINDVGASLVLCSQKYRDKFQDIVKKPFIVDGPSVGGVYGDTDMSTLPSVTANNAALVLFTSGTTGQPKGTVTDHGAFVTGAINHSKGMHIFSTSRVLQFASLTFDAAIMEILTTLIVGGTICIPSDFERMNDIPGAVKRMGVNWMFSTPSLASTLMPRTIPTVKTVILGGEAVSAADVAKWKGRSCLIDGYGPSECTICSTTNMLLDEEGNEVETGFDNVGKAVSGRIWVVDPSNHDKLMPVGSIGELLIEGRGVARGYLNNPEKTAAAFIDCPKWLTNIKPRERIYKTGDLVRYNSDGSINFVSRKDTQIKLNGQRIELGEIEHHVKANLPEDIEATVELVSRGQVNALAVFFATRGDVDSAEYSATATDDCLLPMSDDARSIAQDLDRSLAGTLPAYMIPTLFLPLIQLPFTKSSGKLDRAKLRNIVRDLPGEAMAAYRLSSNVNKRVPRTAMEKQLQKLWADVLDIKKLASVGADDSFFRLGGDSITAMKLVVAARAEEISLDVADIFRTPKLADLAVLCASLGRPKAGATPLPEHFTLLRSNSVDELLDEVAEECFNGEGTIMDAYPCSPLQEALITMSAKKPGAYVAQYVFRLGPDVDVSKFKAAWQQVVDSVDILRTRIVHMKSSQFVQVVFRGQPVVWHSAGSIESAKKTGINLPSSNGGELTRYTIVSSTDLDSRFFVWSLHHSLYDGWSLPTLLKMVEKLYLDSSMSPTTVPYSLFVKYLSDFDTNSSDNFWKAKLEGASPLQFPQAQNVDPDRTRQIKASHHSIILPRGAAGTDVTVSSVIRASWSLVVAAHSGSDDVVFGEVLAGRDIAVSGIQDISGPTISVVPNRIQIDRALNAEDFLGEVQRAGTDLIPFQHSGLQNIKQLGPDAAVACDFQNLLVIQPASEDSQSGFWSQIDDGPVQSNFSTYPLMVECHAGKGKLDVIAYYDTDVLSSWNVEQLLFQFDSVIAQLGSKSKSGRKTKVGEIQPISPQDIESLRAWNRDEPELTDRCLHSVFEQNSVSTPRATAVCAWDGDFSYRELRDHATQLAHHLITLGVGPEVFVPICMDRSRWVVVAILGVLMAGGAYVPLDPSSPLSRHEVILQDIKASIILCSHKYEGRYEELVAKSMTIDEDAMRNLSQYPRRISARSKSTNAAYVIYTSGSTGKPKGVVIEHRSISTSIWAWRDTIHMKPTSRVFHFGSLAFDASLLEIFGALTYGACVCIPSEESRLSNLAESLASFKATWTFITPSLANILEPSEVPSLEVMLCGGEALSMDIIDKWATKITFIEVYGPTECAVLSTENSRVGQLRNPLNIGYAFPGARTWIVNPNNHNQLAPLGSVGELLIEGPVLSRGYLNNAEKTSESFIMDPTWMDSIIPANGPPSTREKRRMYKSGDLAKYDSDGSLIFVGRKDNQVKLRGQRLELDEIEYALSKDADVRHGLVMVPKSGPFKKRLVAILSLIELPTTQSQECNLIGDPTDNATAATICTRIQDRLTELLPGYMVPDTWIAVQSIPLTSSGKSERRTVGRWLESVDQKTFQDILSTKVDSDSVEQLSDIESVIQKTVAHVLNLPVESVRLQSSFLGLGGDSITAMQLLALCRKEKIQLTLPEVLRSKSLRHLASKCGIHAATSYQEEKLDHDFELSPIQQMYFDSQGDLDHKRASRFNQSFLLKLSRSVQTQELKRAIETLVVHHSMLRARFTKDSSGAWQQKIPRTIQRSYRFCTHDIDDIDDIAQFIDISQNSLDIVRGPVFSVDFFRTFDDDQILFLVAHHTVIDMMSWRVVLQDLEEILTSGALSLAKPLSFQTWCRMQAENSKKLPAHSIKSVLPIELPPHNVGYWKLGDHSNSYGDINTETFALNEATTATIFGDANQVLRTEPIDIFLSSLAHSFSRVFTDRRTPSIYNESHGREAWDANIDLSRTVGWFTTLYPVYVEVSADENDVLDTLKRMKDVRHRVPGSGRPFLAYRYLNPHGRTDFESHNGPMEILFNYLGRTQQFERSDSLLQQWSCPLAMENAEMISDVGLRTTRLALIEISAVVVDNKLQFSFVYNRHMKHQALIHRWISECKTGLEEIVNCLLGMKGQRVLTASDFPLLPLSHDGMTRLANVTLPAIGVKIEDVEDIYPCAPMQEGMLLGQLRDPEFYQFHTTFEVTAPGGGRVDAKRLANSWCQVVNRHQALRTIFTDSVSRGDVFIQVVVKKVVKDGTLIFCDDANAVDEIESFVANEESELENPQLPHQFTVFQTNKGRVYVRLEMNHAVMDASSLPIIFQDLALAYDEHLPETHAPLFSEYIAYLKRKNPSLDVHFWNTYLDGVRACNFPALNDKLSRNKSLHSAQLSFDRFSQLQSWCKQKKLTLSNVMQAAWALCLRNYTDSEDVCFGYLASGRDLPIDGVQGTVGPFINMLVCRVKFDQMMCLEDVIQRVQDDYLRGLEHQHTSLAQVQHELGLPAGAGLFNSAVSIQGDNSPGGSGNSSISFSAVAADDPTEYALTLSIGISQGSEGAVLRYWSNILSQGQAEKLLKTLGSVLDSVLDKPALRVSAMNRCKPQDEIPIVHSQPTDQTEQLRLIVKECVSEIMGQMLKSGDLKSNSLSDLNTISEQVDQQISRTVVTPAPMVDHSRITSVPKEPEFVHFEQCETKPDHTDNITQRLLALWAEFLQVPENSIASDDSFFQLGGDSIVAMKMVGSAREEGLSLTVADVFRCPVFGDMLDVVQLPVEVQQPKQPKHPKQPKEPSKPQASLSPNPKDTQPARKASRRSNHNIATEVRNRRRSMYESFSLIEEPNVDTFLRETVSPKVGLFKGGIIDVLPATDFQALSITGSLLESRWMLNYFYLEGRGDVDFKKLRHAVNQVVDAFEILRTVFIPYNGQFYQVILKKLQPRFNVETVGDLDEFAGVLRQRDMEAGPRPGETYLQFTVARLRNSDKHRIIIRISHAQYDGVCLPHILEALRAGYRGEPIPESPPFSAYVRDAVGQTTNDHYRYWSSLLKGSRMTDIVRRRGPNYSRGPKMPTLLKRKVRVSSLASYGITSATLIKAAWSLVLAQISAQSDVVFGNVISGRNASVPGLENIVGPCVNTVPVRVPFKQGWTALDLLRHLQEQQLNNMPYESLGYRELIRQCTSWPDWTNFTTVCQHQNLQTKPKIHLGDNLYEFSGVGAQEDFADFTVLSVPQESGFEIEICLIFGLSNIGMTAAATRAIFENLCSTVEDFSTNPNKVLPSPAEIAAMPRQTRDHTARRTARISVSLNALDKKDLLVYSDILIRSWRQVLGDASVDIGPETSFFDLGGDIMGLAQVSTLLEQDGFKLRLEDLVSHPIVMEQLVLMADFTRMEEKADFGKQMPEAQGQIDMSGPPTMKGYQKILGLAMRMLKPKPKHRLAPHLESMEEE